MHDDLPQHVREALDAALGGPIARLRPLGGGCVSDVRLAEGEGGGRVVVKLDREAGGWPGPRDRVDLRGERPIGGLLETEAAMLRTLAERSAMPVPEVLGVVETPGASGLLLEHVETSGGLDAAAQRHAAELLTESYVVPAPGPADADLEPAFGFEHPTPIGGLAQPNAWRRWWVAFFAEQRIAAFAEAGAREGVVSGSLAGRLSALAARLGEFIDEPTRPALIHGDLWGGNVLTTRTEAGGRIAALIDPAVYVAHPEVELAFSTMFGTFGEPFFDRYAELNPGWDRAGFFGSGGGSSGSRIGRRDVYNVFPLLVHARLFDPAGGGSYAGQIASTLARLGL